jgi:Kef-type K+ transport system membrane component KefB
MNQILSVGLILLAALLAGHLAQRIRLPEVTGYLLMGVLIGPGALDVITHDNLEALQLLSEMALGLILFGIGTIFEARMMRQLGRRVAWITLAEALGAGVLVTSAMLLLGMPPVVAVLLGVVAMETAPATTLMVIREYDSRGPLTDMVLALLALNNMLVLAAFGVVAAGVGLALGTAPSAYASMHALLWGTAGSVALGALAGLLLDAWAGRVESPSETMTLAIGTVLLTVGAARALGVSPLIAALTVGATIANTSARVEPLVNELRRADPPLYAAFFVLAGAELPVALLPQIGVAGTAYVVARSIGKVTGAWLAVRRTALPAAVRRNIGLCLLSSSSLAIGLTIQVRQQFPEMAEGFAAVVLSAVIVFEIAGPILARTALFQAGEVPSPGGVTFDAALADAPP